jgi:glycerol-3-phosphate acyltransferase PlsX
MRIVVDAMGSDEYPGPDVGGAVLAAREWGDEIILVGDKARVEAELAKHNTDGLKLKVVHAGQVVEMTDKPSEAVEHKTDSSMHVGLRLVGEGQADGFVSAGNTGAVLAVATLVSPKRIRGVKRPALTAVFKNPVGYTIMTDFGANAEVRPEWLVQFGLMASLYAKLALVIPNPRVALLSNGEEEGKGNELIHAATPLMKQQTRFNFIGSVEPKEVLQGKTDIVVHDGFTGNIMGKTLEATASMVKQLIREEITANIVSSLGGLLAKSAFDRVGKRIDPFEVGGAPLLGVNGVVIIAHGRSNDVAIKNAVRQARQAIQGKIIESIRAGLEGE